MVRVTCALTVFVLYVSVMLGVALLPNQLDRYGEPEQLVSAE